MRVLFCGGGTGGHVYPALAVADAVARKEGPDATMLYIGAKGEIEEKLVPRSGVALAQIIGGGLHGVGPVQFVRNLLRLAQGFFQAWRIIGRFRPDVLFLTGGYVSVPVALAMWLRRRPIVVYLPDVEPGLAIKWLSRIATRVAVSVEASRQYLPDSAEPPRGNVVVTGYPLRSQFYQDQQALRQLARTQWGIPREDKVLLVFGGSRGARTINRALGAILEPVLALGHVIHISGTLDAQECRARRDALPAAARARYHLYDYVHEMERVLAAADLVVARAGAGTLGEFPFFGLPAILVPYPYAWRYQKVNADYLADRGAAIRLNDEDMPERLLPTLQTLLKDEEQLKLMSEHARTLARPHAADRLVDLLARICALGLGPEGGR